jgi:hypothetical protein
MRQTYSVTVRDVFNFTTGNLGSVASLLATLYKGNTSGNTSSYIYHIKFEIKDAKDTARYVLYLDRN